MTAYRCRYAGPTALVVMLSLFISQVGFGKAQERPRATEDSGATLLYLTAAEWGKKTADQKAGVAADFMRIFCVNQTMSPVSLADCLDRTAATGPLFERALSCASVLSE